MEKNFVGKINSTPQILNLLHSTYKWIPNSTQIRPSTRDMNTKMRDMREMSLEWTSSTDYLRHKIFGLPYTTKNGLKSCSQIPTEKVFMKCSYPYQIQEGSHYVLWYPTTKQEISDEEIDKDIQKEIKKLGECNYAWYPNPKMTMPEYFHVQVFISL